MRKLALVRVSYQDDFFILYRVLTGSFHILLFEGMYGFNMLIKYTCDSKIKITNVTHGLPVPVYWQTDSTPNQVVVLRLHDTIARFRTGVKFSPWYNNRSELTPG